MRPASPEQQAFWRSIGNQLGCWECRRVPRCERCESAIAQTVVSLFVEPRPTLLATLQRSHMHVCDPCYDAIAATWSRVLEVADGAPRVAPRPRATRDPRSASDAGPLR